MTRRRPSATRRRSSLSRCVEAIVRRHAPNPTPTLSEALLQPVIPPGLFHSRSEVRQRVLQPLSL